MAKKVELFHSKTIHVRCKVARREKKSRGITFWIPFLETSDIYKTVIKIFQSGLEWPSTALHSALSNNRNKAIAKKKCKSPKTIILLYSSEVIDCVPVLS